MEVFEYMKIKYDTIPPANINKYNLDKLVHNDHVYIEIRKGMYGLKQAGVLANLHLESLLKKDGYIKTKHTPGLWKHINRPIAFTLCVDDFGVKYIGKQHAEHLIRTLEKHYEALTVDWEGTKFCGIDMKWNYHKRVCDISIQDYVARTLTKFSNWQHIRRCHSPSKYIPPQYGQKIQYAAPADTTTPLNDDKIKQLQQVIGRFLFYGRVTDYTMLHALNSLATAQSSGTQNTKQAMLHFSTTAQHILMQQCVLKLAT